MKIYINSTLREIPEYVHTVSELLEFLRIPKTGTGVGINNRLVVAREWDMTRLNDQDRVMIISATYGG